MGSELDFHRVQGIFLNKTRHCELGRYDVLRDYYISNRWEREHMYSSVLVAAAHFWDPTNHLFRFGLDELCPTYEEFCSLLELDCTKLELATPHDHNKKAREQLETFLRIPLSHCKNMIVDGKVDLKKIMNYFIDKDKDCKAGRPLYSSCRAALFLILFAEILLYTGSQYVDLTIIGVVNDAWKRDLSPVPIILAETLNGLDEVCNHDLSVSFDGNFRGSPRLLYVWICDRLSLVPPPKNHYASSIINRRINIDFTNMPLEDIVYCLAKQARKIRWFIPWYRLDRIAKGMSGEPYIQLRGLTASSFYLPGRLYRQFNVPNVLPYPPNFNNSTEQLSMSKLKSRNRSWATRYVKIFEDSETGIKVGLPEGDIRARVEMMFLDGRNTKDQNMIWFQGLESQTPATFENIVKGYKDYDMIRVMSALEEPVWVENFY